MPTSHWHYITPILDLLTSINERRPVLSVLDVGCGSGKWGFLVRDALEFYQRGVYYRPDWKTRVVGVEIFRKYRNPVHGWAYDEVHWGDIREIVDRLPDFDVVFAMEVIEHLDKRDGVELLGKLVRKSNRGVIMSFPPEVDTLGRHVLERKASHGNAAEEHVSVWTPDDVAAYRSQTIAPLTYFLEALTQTLVPAAQLDVIARGDALVLTPGSRLDYELPDCSNLEIVVLKHPWSGKLRVQDENGRTLRDEELFSAQGFNDSIRFQFASGRAPRRLTLTSAAHPRSQGSEAWVRAVTVK